MKLALQVLAFNVDGSLRLMIKNAKPYVDKIFIAYPHLSWNYSQSGRIRNPTSLQSINQLIEAKVEVIEGVWEHDEDTRNELLEAARMQGFGIGWSYRMQMSFTLKSHGCILKENRELTLL